MKRRTRRVHFGERQFCGLGLSRSSRMRQKELPESGSSQGATTQTHRQEEREGCLDFKNLTTTVRSSLSSSSCRTDDGMLLALDLFLLRCYDLPSKEFSWSSGTAK